MGNFNSSSKDFIEHVFYVFEAFKMAVRASAEAKHEPTFDNLMNIEIATELALKAVLTRSGKQAATDALITALEVVDSCEVRSLRSCLKSALQAVKAISEVNSVSANMSELLDLDRAIMDFKNAVVDLAKFPGSVSREDIEIKTVRNLDVVLTKFT